MENFIFWAVSDVYYIAQTEIFMENQYVFYSSFSETYSERYQTSKMERFANVVFSR